jgi:O-antigen/teichoic acid export membrane protein
VALGLVLTLVVARMGPAAQGAFALFMAVESGLIAAASGFGVAIARRLSHHGEQPRGLTSAALLACLALGLVCAAALAALQALPGRTGAAYGALALLAWAAPLLFIAPNLQGLWLGRGRMGPLALLTLGTPVLALAAVWLAQSPGQALALPAVLAAWVAARLAVAGGALLAAARGGLLGRPDGAALQREWGFIATIGATNLIGIANYKIDLVLVERFIGLQATGVYSIAVMAGELLWLVSSAVTTAAYARIGQPDAGAAARLTIRAVQSSVALLAVLAPMLWLAAAWLLPPLLGPAYAAALPVLAVLLPGLVAYGAASALSAWFTNHAGRPRLPAALAGLSLGINIVIALVAIPAFGMLGAALATSLSYAATVIIGARWFLRAAGLPWGALLRPAA